MKVWLQRPGPNLRRRWIAGWRTVRYMLQALAAVDVDIGLCPFLRTQSIDPDFQGLSRDEPDRLVDTSDIFSTSRTSHSSMTRALGQAFRARLVHACIVPPYSYAPKLLELLNGS